MAVVTKGTDASMDAATGQLAPMVAGDLYAGEALGAVAPCYIKASDGKVYQSNGTAANEAAKFDGFTAVAYAAGEAVTLFGAGARFKYGTGLTIGTDLFVAATAGALDTAATTGGVRPVARVLSATDIRCTRVTDAD
jgi:hypothetical protein